jgi:hypothetical protein
MRLALVAMVFLACGPSTKELQHATDTTYSAHRDEIWPEIVAVLKSRFEKLVVAQMDGARFVSQWMPTGRYIEVGDPGDSNATRLELARVTVELVGENPFKVAVKVEAAAFISDVAPPKIINGPTEPAWVASLNDDLTVQIYQRLKRFATVPGAATAPATKPAPAPVPATEP